MNYYLLRSNITILFLLSLATLFGCQQQLAGGEQGAVLHLVPHFSGAAGKATEVGFQTGDQVGLYATDENRMLAPEGNLIENALMEAVDQSGTIELRGKPVLHYPSERSAVRLYAYYPYQATVGSPVALNATVADDQSAYARYTASDWCWGTLATTPSQEATPILFAHRTAQLNLTIALPASGTVGGKSIERVVLASLHGVQLGGLFDLSNGGWSDLTGAGSVLLYRPSASAAQFLGMVPPQTSQVGHVLASVTIQYSDQSTEMFDFSPVDPIEFKVGQSTTVGLRLNDQGVVSLDAVQVDEWVETESDGAVVDPINNQFTAHWRLPSRGWDRVSRVELVVALPAGGVKVVEASSVQVTAGGDATAASYTFGVALGQLSGVAYPYQIAEVRFYDGGDLLQGCTSVKGAVVYRSGAYTIGVEQDRLLAVRSGTISDWNELLYGDRLRGVDNGFVVQLIEYPSYANVGGVRLTIDGQPYTFNNVTSVAGSHAMLSQTSVFRFPDANGKAPYKYPFVVEGIVLLDGLGNALGDGVYGSAIRVSRAGEVTMQLYRGVLSALSTTVTGYNSSSSAGRPEYGGAVRSNPIRVVYCDGRQGAACDAVARVDLTIGGREVVLSGYAMEGTRFAAQSRSPHIDIVSGGVDRPLVYPYSITAVKLKRADGLLLAAASFTDPLVVNWWGEVSIELMGAMQDVPHVEYRPTPADYVEIGGLRWAVGNLVAVDEHNCKVGAPADGGVYFQFGSLIGWTGGANGNGVGQGALGADKLDKFAWPTELSTTKPTFSWAGNDGNGINKLNDYYFNYSMAPWDIADSFSDIGKFSETVPGQGTTVGDLRSGRYANLGVGDPCTYYLGDPWRLPTTAEHVSLDLSGATWATNGGANGRWFGPSAVFFPASGGRDITGETFNVGSYGNFRSSSVFGATYGHLFHFNNSFVNPAHKNPRCWGYPARCVADAPKKVNTPTANDYVEIDMGAGKKLKWAKGNLIAADGHGCKVGAPNDGGLYFQFGSLIGWKGGSLANNGNGRGLIPVAWRSKYWGGAADWSWNNDVAVTPTELVGKPTAYPNTNAANIETLNDYYFNYSKAPYETRFKDIRDYPGLASGALASKGIGDACSYYLGGTWRLPTNEEFKILCNTTAPIGVNTLLPWETGGGRWSTYNGITGGYLSNNRLFFSAGGWRYDTGIFYAPAGEGGYYWCSTIDGFAGGFLTGFTYSHISLQSTYTRSCGFSVRCVSE